MFLRLLASPLPQIIFYYTIITFYYTISHSSRNDEVKKLVATWLFHSSHKNWRLAMKTSSQSLKCRHDNHYKLHHRGKYALHKWSVRPLLQSYLMFLQVFIFQLFCRSAGIQEEQSLPVVWIQHCNGTHPKPLQQAEEKERSLSALHETFNLKTEKSVCSIFANVCFQSFLSRKYMTRALHH